MNKEIVKGKLQEKYMSDFYDQHVPDILLEVEKMCEADTFTVSLDISKRLNYVHERNHIEGYGLKSLVIEYNR